MMQRYEAWQDPGGIVSLTPADSVAGDRARGLLHVEAKLLFAIDAATFEEACAVFHLRMGYEPYKPLGSPTPCPECGALLYPEGTGQCWQCGKVVARPPMQGPAA